MVLNLVVNVPKALNDGLLAAAATVGSSFVTTASVVVGLSGAIVGLHWLLAKLARLIYRSSGAVFDAIFVIVGVLASLLGGAYFFWLIFSLAPASDSFAATVGGTLGFLIGTYFFFLVVYVLAAPD